MLVVVAASMLQQAKSYAIASASWKCRSPSVFDSARVPKRWVIEKRAGPGVPRFVEMTITPFAAEEPSIPAPADVTALRPFEIAVLATGTPSTTYSGWDLPKIDVTPCILTCIPPP